MKKLLFTVIFVFSILNSNAQTIEKQSFTESEISTYQTASIESSEVKEIKAGGLDDLSEDEKTTALIATCAFLLGALIF